MDVDGGVVVGDLATTGIGGDDRPVVI